MKIGILGGTGPQGRGLAIRLAASGHEVLIGSRSAERAEAIATEIARDSSGRIWVSAIPTRPPLSW